MFNVGVIGLGMMGATHLDAYVKREDVRIVAVSDKDPSRLAGSSNAQGNIEGHCTGGFDLAAADVKRYADGAELIADPDVELVSICVPTPLHELIAVEAIRAGKHILLEKPLARTSEQCERIIKVAEHSPGCIVMPAMCMRFWPGWDWLKQTIDSKRYGKVLSASFQRITSLPDGAFYRNGQANGGAILDLHIHDTDFVQYCFGRPREITSFGYSSVTEGIDHVITRYDCGGPLIVAEGSWALAKGYGFTMRYLVNFEHATAWFDISAESPLHIVEVGGEAHPVPLPEGMGYDREIAYLLDCIGQGTQPTTVTLRDAADAVEIVEAEADSIRTGRPCSC